MSTGQRREAGQSSAVAQGVTGHDRVRLAQAGPLKIAEEWFDPEQNCAGSQLADMIAFFFNCPHERSI